MLIALIFFIYGVVGMQVSLPRGLAWLQFFFFCVEAAFSDS
jgi:hypothetical protein